MVTVGSKKQMGFRCIHVHDHIKIHVCGVLKRNGIMLIHAFGGRINDYNAAAARNYSASSNEMNALLSGSKLR